MWLSLFRVQCCIMQGKDVIVTCKPPWKIFSFDLALIPFSFFGKHLEWYWKVGRHVQFINYAHFFIILDRLVEGMRELTMIQDSPDLILGAPLLLIHAHRRCKTVDKEAIQQLEAAVKKDRKSCSSKVSRQSFSLSHIRHVFLGLLLC